MSRQFEAQQKFLKHSLQLMRFDRPVGWLLLLWPTLCALWIGADGSPPAELVLIFSVAVIVMRSAGCVINDYADRDIDPEVERTKSRPLAAGHLSPRQALAVFFTLIFCACLLLFMLPPRVWPWAIPAALITIVYPYMKRFIAAPQLVLGVAFSFSIPMVYVALARQFDLVFVLQVVANITWVVMYDTIYAMADREDDVKIGVRSSAIFFGSWDRIVVLALQLLVLVIWMWIANELSLSKEFYFLWTLVSLQFLYQQYLIAKRDSQQCLQAFLNNAWLGGFLWFAIVISISS